MVRSKSVKGDTSDVFERLAFTEKSIDAQAATTKQKDSGTFPL